MKETKYEETIPAIFAWVMRHAMESSDKAQFLTFYTSAEYEEMGARCYLSKDNRSGYTITKDGVLISVFSAVKGIGKTLIESAKENGAYSLDCFDGYLTSFYSDNGFKEYDRISFNDEYAPANWDYDHLGRPDLVYMRLV